MRRPLVSIAISLALGILLGGVVPIQPHRLLTVAALLAAAGLLLLILHAAPRWCFISTLAALVATGAAYALLRSSEYSGAGLSAMLSTEPRIIRVRGSVASMPEEKLYPARRPGEEGRVRSDFLLRVTAVRHADRWVPLRGRLRVFGEGSARRLAYGDALELPLSARRVAAPKNPGEFDYARYLARKGISGQAGVGALETIRPVKAGSTGFGMRWVFALKRRITASIDERVAPGPARILKCLILGDRDALTEEQERIFQETGTVHFLAISGLHVGLLAAFCWWVLVAGGVRHPIAAIVVLAVVLLYAVLAGFRPSVQRAAVMCAVICGAFLFRRRPNLPSSLSLALILVLLHEPAELYSAGLQLSFVAVLGIWLFAEPIERTIFRLPDELDRLQAPEERSWLQHPVRWFVQKTLCISLAAWVVTLPLRLMYFNMMTPLAPLASVALLPAVWLVLMAGLPGTLLAPFLGGYAQPLLTTAAVGARAVAWVAGLLARVPGVAFHVPPPGWAWVILCYILLTAFAWRALLRLNARRIAALALAPAIVYLGCVWHQPAPPHPRVTMLSVGMGNCVLVQFPDGKNLLFDAGSAWRPEVGSRVIAPALWSLGVRRLDCVVLSHGDADHYNGFAELARRIRVKRLALSPYFEKDEGAADCLREVSTDGVEVVRIGAGDRIAGFSGTEIAVLWPPRQPGLARNLSSNERSVLLHVRAGNSGTVLLTGDFGRRAATLLLREKPDLAADVLQVPHHGLRDPAATQLADAIGARVALIPGGERAAIPSPYAATGARLLATDDCGMVTVELIPGERPRVSTFLQGKAPADL